MRYLGGVRLVLLVLLVAAAVGGMMGVVIVAVDRLVGSLPTPQLTSLPQTLAEEDLKEVLSTGGVTREGVRDLLGEPDHVMGYGESVFPEIATDKLGPGELWTYHRGQVAGPGGPFNVYAIRFDRTGVVVQHWAVGGPRHTVKGRRR
jgi:hypothetical protein